MQLSENGFSHHIVVPAIVIVLVAVVGVRALTASHALAPSQGSSQITNNGLIKSDLPLKIHSAHQADKSGGINGLCINGACYYYADYNAVSLSATGATVQITQAHPKVDSNDYHSLAELRVEDSGNNQAIEIGWTVDPILNHDSYTRLFIFYWVNGVGACYDGCGFVPIPNAKNYKPIQRLATNGTVGTYAINFSNNEWVLSYNGVAFGYFPESLWNGNFTNVGAVQIYGEVASRSSNTPESQMGNGKLGTITGASSFKNLTIQNNTTTPQYYFGSVNSKIYSYGNATSNGFNFGGPGYPPGTVLPQPPTVSLDPATINGNQVTINGSATAGTGSSISYLSCNWGDGSPVTTCDFPSIHIYSNPGTYVVTVTAYANNNTSGNLSEYVTIP